MATWTGAEQAVSVTCLGEARHELMRAGHEPRMFEGGCGIWRSACRRCGAPAVVRGTGGQGTLTGLMLDVRCDRDAVREIARQHTRQR
jgi:hypothetical protein